jgi:hypothetical protein
MHSLSPSRMMHVCPSHSPWLDCCNYVWGSVQVMKLLIMRLSPATNQMYTLLERKRQWLGVSGLAIRMFPA